MTPTETTQHDGEGNVVLQADGHGDVTRDTYDPLRRQVAETNPVSGTSLITYPATQKTAEQDAPDNVTHASYDPAGRLLTVQDAVNEVTQYQYDNVANTTAITSGDGTAASQMQTRQYDARNRVISAAVSGPGTTPETTRTGYDQDGNVAQVGGLPDCTATYTPQHGGEGHWSVN